MALGGTALVLVLAVAGVVAFAHRPSGRAGTETASVALAPPPVALAGDEAITRADVLQQQALMSSEGDAAPPSRRDALEVLIRDVILAAEARRRGLGMDEAAAAALASSHRHLYEQGQLPDREDVRHLIASLRSVGVTEDGYWRELAPRFYRRAYAVAALRSREGDRLDRLYLRLRRQAGVVVLDEAFLRDDAPAK